MPTTEQLTALAEAPRNGTENYYRSALCPHFAYTDGVRDFATLAKCYWLLDIIGSEVADVMLRRYTTCGEICATLTVRAEGGKAMLALTVEALRTWSKRLPRADLPDGLWRMRIAIDGLVRPGRVSVVACLATEW
jgi:hypothetical protein